MALHERRAAEIAVAVAGFASSGVFAADGSVSMASWMRCHLRMTQPEASRWVREGRFLTAYQPVLDAAISGELSAGQVAALAKAVTAPTAVLFAEHAAGLIKTIAPLPVADGQTVCSAWRSQAEALVEMPEPKVPDRSLKSATLADGTIMGIFVLDPSGAAQWDQALGTAKEFPAGDERTVSMRELTLWSTFFRFLTPITRRRGHRGIARTSNCTCTLSPVTKLTPPIRPGCTGSC